MAKIAHIVKSSNLYQSVTIILFLVKRGQLMRGREERRMICYKMVMQGND
jgi:hypothetical protein